MRKTLALVFGSLAFVLIYASSAWAQANWGAISGYVTDPAGAAIAGASVDVTEVRTGVVTRGATDSVGLYNITHLSPGEYTVRVENQGFKRFVREHIVLTIDSTVRVDTALELGAVTQEVTVTAAAPLLKTEKTDVAKDFNQQTLATLPTLGHNVTYLYETVPGAVHGYMQLSFGENPSGADFVQVNGMRESSNDYLIDGITNTACCFSEQPVFVVNQEAVEEIKMSTNSYDPEFGSASGLVAQYVTKSGTNQVHGSMFWANRNNKTFGADPFTEKVPGTGPNGKGTGPAPFNWNQGGAAIGGPIRKNKMFIFGDYQFARSVLGGTATATTPLAAWRQGNFSNVIATAPIFDPLTGNSDGTGRVQFAGNIIPMNRIDKVATNILNLFPLPNVGTANTTDVNYVGGTKGPTRNDQFDVRWDWNISDKDKVFFRETYMYSYALNTPIFGIVAGGPPVTGLVAESVPTWDHQTALNYTHTFSSNLLGEFRGGFLRFKLRGFQTDDNLQTNNQVGIPNINTGSPITGGLAGMVVMGPVGAFTIGPGPTSVALPRIDTINGFEGVNNWTFIKGRHQFRWGADLRRFREDLFTINAHTEGYMEFSQNLTGSANVSGSGIGTASLLLGEPSNFQRGVFNFIPRERAWRDGLYWQDIWRVNPKLTFNYGLRWDYIGPTTTPLKEGLGEFDPTTGLVHLANLGNVSASADVQAYHKAFAPRLGIAYKLTDKTVLRTAYGRTYFSNGYGGGGMQSLVTVYPIAPTQIDAQTNIYQGLFPLEQGPPAPPVFTPPANGLLPLPNGVSAFDRQAVNNPSESSDQWNFMVERSLSGNAKFTVGYLGNKGTHVFWSRNINAAQPGIGAVVNRRPLYVLYGITQSVSGGSNCLDTNFNSLELNFDKRFAKGYSLTSNFTWSKEIDYGGLETQGGVVRDPWHQKANRGVGDSQDIAAVWQTTHIWNLPYGPGLRWGSNATGIAKAVLSGWNFNGVTIVQSGQAMTPRMTNNATGNDDYGGQKPDRVPGVALYNATKTTADWFNLAAFQAPQFPGQPVQCCRFGNTARGTLRGPGYLMTTWSFGKDFSFKTPLNREATLLQFRWENYNFFNHANWGVPNLNVDTALGGRITTLAGAGAQATGLGYVPMRRMQFTLRLQF